MSIAGIGPVQRDLIAGVAADEQHHVGAVHDAVGGRRRIAAGDPGRETVRRRDDAARPQRRRDRGGERLGQRQHLRPGPGRGGAVAGDDHEAARAGQQRSGPLDVAFVGNRPVQRNAPRLGFDDRRLGGLPQFDHVALAGH